ncbi:MFS transporter [Roseivivax isoporae]|uniref:NreB protein n=1 Tax=Roseivivax isoporae LMG 25204 TaxID=1449351 RepID=X7F6K3_9RHOB|nr:MFS transporter [Roseivivax isoporae]ETX27731.1 NreB protein [Roseivivax isoporae LMG 25204]
MTGPLANPSFRTLFAAQVCSLVAVGLLTVALSLAAWRIGGDAAAGRILGLILALKMVAYVGLAPLAETFFAGRPRKRVMIGLDLGRMALLVPMAFATTTWQLGLLAFVFFALSAGFTPLFQSVIPDLLPDDDSYARGLAWSRVAYTLESVSSPVIAAAALSLIAPSQLFLLAALAFVGSVAALRATRVPPHGEGARKGPFLRRALRGLWIYHRTPRLRGLFLLNLALSLAMAWVLVNTVVFAGQVLGDAEGSYPVLMAAYGVGAALAAFAVPRLVARSGERDVMLGGVLAFAATGAVLATVPLPPTLPALLPVWFAFGAASSAVLTPGGLVITRSAARSDRPAVFAAQFSLSHAGWLLAYPLAGWLGSALPLATALGLLSAGAVAVALLAALVWPADDRLERAHSHPDLPADHPHLREHGARDHVHAYRIDDLHPRWRPDGA